MDLVDIISEKKFLGQEFLTWLWYKSEERGGAILLTGAGDIQLVFEKHMLLESGEGESLERLTCNGLQTELQEARTGLFMGKKLERAHIYLAKGDYEWRFSLSATLFEFRNVSLPKTVTVSFWRIDWLDASTYMVVYATFTLALYENRTELSLTFPAAS